MAAVKQCYYEVLQVAKTASGDELKKSYRKLAMEFHPDRNPGNTEAEHKFKVLSEAYDILRDEQKRAAYDRYGHAAFEQGGGGFDFGTGFADIFDEMFGDMMGRRGGRGGRGPARGQDLRYNMEITLEEAFYGKKASISVPSSIAKPSLGRRISVAIFTPMSCEPQPESGTANRDSLFREAWRRGRAETSSLSAARAP